MAWKRTLILIRRNTWKKRKRKTKNGSNGNKTKRKDSMKHNKKLRKSTSKLTNFGKNSLKPKKLIGNKNTTLIGSNGKWKSKAEKSTISKEKREELSTNKKTRNMKSKKNFKSTSVKFNSVINWSSTLTASKLISTEPKKTEMKRKKPLMSLQNLLLIHNGKRKRLKSWFQRSRKLMKIKAQKKAKKAKSNKKRRKNPKPSTFHTPSKTNLNLWEFWPHLQSRKLTKRLRSWEKERNFSKEAALKTKFRKKTHSFWLKLRQRSLQAPKRQQKRKSLLRKSSLPFER